MTQQEKRDLAARLVIHADNVARIGTNQPAFLFPALIKDLRAAAIELRADGEALDK